MDNKEAIAVIRNNWPPSNYTMLIEALELSIKSLESAESAQTAHNSESAPCRPQFVCVRCGQSFVNDVHQCSCGYHSARFAGRCTQ
jgi:hypothetical protein